MTPIARLAPLALLLIGAAPPPDAVPLGAFRTWGIHPAATLHLTSGGLTIDVVAQPCARKLQDEGCNIHGVSNQATVTVTQPGLPPFTMTSVRQASFVRVAAVRLDRRQARAGVVVDNQWGGSAGLTAVSVIEPTAGGFRRVPLERSAGEQDLQGQVADDPFDLSGDGRVDVVLENRGFAYGLTCNACTPRPPLVLTVRHGSSVDISADPAVRSVFARDIAARERICFSSATERNGNCAAFVADAARLGRVASAWRAMLAHYDRRPQPGATAAFPAALRTFLIEAGYITPARAATLPVGDTREDRH